MHDHPTLSFFLFPFRLGPFPFPFQLKGQSASELIDHNLLLEGDVDQALAQAGAAAALVTGDVASSYLASAYPRGSGAAPSSSSSASSARGRSLWQSVLSSADLHQSTHNSELVSSGSGSGASFACAAAGSAGAAGGSAAGMDSASAGSAYAHAHGYAVDSAEYLSTGGFSSVHPGRLVGGVRIVELDLALADRVKRSDLADT